MTIPRINRCPALAGSPTVQMMLWSDRLRHTMTVDTAHRVEQTPRMIRALDAEDLLAEAVRIWALILGEVGVARLPGGDPAQPAGEMQTDASDHDTTCPCGDWRNHLSDPWYDDVAATLRAARDRDGTALFHAVTTALSEQRRSAGTSVLSYTVSMADSARLVFDESSAGRDNYALLHGIGYYARSPTHWSAAGQTYRLCAAMLTTLDMGPAFADAIMGPEIAAIGKMTNAERYAVVGILGPLYAGLMVDDPGREVTVANFRLGSHPAGAAPDHDESTRRQAQGIAIAVRLAVAFRHGTDDDIIAVVESGSAADLALGLFGLCNLLALRVRDLFGR